MLPNSTFQKALRLSTGLFVLIFLASNPVYSQFTLQDSLVAHYPFDGDAQDYSGNGNHGTVYGATLTTDRFGNPNSAYQFDGIDDYIEYTANGKFNEPLPLTVAAWILLDDHHRNMVFANNWAENSYNGIFIGNATASSAKFHVQYGDGGETGPNSRRSKTGTTDLTLNTWYHVAAIIRGPQDMEIYINGLNDCGTYSGTGGQLYYIPGETGQSGISDPYAQPTSLDYYHGKIDDLRFYNRELDEAEILALSEQTSPSTAGLVTRDTTICQGETVVIYGGLSNEYEWYPAQGLSCTSCSTPQATPEITTTYTVLRFNSPDCRQRQTFTITVEDCQPPACNTIPLQAQFDLNLESVFATLTDQSIGEIDSVSILWGDLNQTSIPPSGTADHVYQEAGTYNLCLNAYHLLADGQTCFDQTCELVEVEEDCAAFGLTPNFTMDLTGLTLQVQDRSTGSIDSLAFSWGMDSSNQIGQGEAREYILPAGGQHEICLTAYGAFPSGKVCSQEICQSVQATANCRLLLPNIFTPNGDGANDEFYPRTEFDIRQMEWKVYDRWGRLMFQSSGTTSRWDGTWKGKPVPTGTYYTTVKYLCGQQTEAQRGHLTLLR